MTSLSHCTFQFDHCPTFKNTKTISSQTPPPPFKIQNPHHKTMYSYICFWYLGLWCHIVSRVVNCPSLWWYLTTSIYCHKGTVDLHGTCVTALLQSAANSGFNEYVHITRYFHTAVPLQWYISKFLTSLHRRKSRLKHIRLGPSSSFISVNTYIQFENDTVRSWSFKKELTATILQY